MANFSMADVHLPMHEKGCEVSYKPREIVYIKDERFLYPSGAKATKRSSTISAVHYQPVPDRLDQIVELDVVKVSKEETIKKHWREGVQLPAKFNEHRPAILDMLTEFQSMFDGHLGRINVAKDRVYLFYNEVRPVRLSSYRAGLTSR